jgi:hypothetical protein
MSFDRPGYDKPYVPKKKKPQRVGSLSSLAGVLPQLCEQLDMNRKVQELSLLSVWPTLVGERYASQTRASAVKKKGARTVLYVKVASASVASELSFQSEGLKEMLNGFAPQTGIKLDAIQFSIGSL